MYISCCPGTLHSCISDDCLLISDNTGPHGNDELPKSWAGVAKKILEDVRWDGGNSKFILSHPEVERVQVGEVSMWSPHSFFNLPRGRQMVTPSPELCQTRASLCYGHQHCHSQRVALDCKRGEKGSPCLQQGSSSRTWRTQAANVVHKLQCLQLLQTSEVGAVIICYLEMEAVLTSSCSGSFFGL